MPSNLRVPDPERVNRISAVLKREGRDGLVCSLPKYVLLCTGYWPVVGTSICLTNADGRQIVIAPQDEGDLAHLGWAEVRSYKPHSLDTLSSVNDSVKEPLREAAQALGITGGRIGFERGPTSEPASYSDINLFGTSITSIIQAAIPGATLVPADHILHDLAAVKTRREIDHIRIACNIVWQAFESGSVRLNTGLTEAAAATHFRAPLSARGLEHEGVARADGFVFCMSGPNAAKAAGAYARSRARTIVKSDLVLTHCNSYADGYWTDVTRTYAIGEPDARKREIYDAVFAARTAALNAIRPGARGSEVDRAARNVLNQRGFGKEFKHSTGHGIGFTAISANARPRIHPKSDDVLKTGMVFNVEPAVYIEGMGGIRHCDMVVVTEEGVEVLTPFQSTLEELIITEDRLTERRRKAA